MSTYTAFLNVTDRSLISSTDHYYHAAHRSYNLGRSYNLSSVNTASAASTAPSGNVVFSASLDHDTLVPVNTIVQYTTVLTNIGNAYNPVTGVFTAPRTGVYAFHIYGLAVPGKGFWLCVYHNDKCLYKAHGSAAASWNMGGNTVAVKVKSGEKVYVRSTSHATALYGDGDNVYGTFTGYILD